MPLPKLPLSIKRRPTHPRRRILCTLLITFCLLLFCGYWFIFRPQFTTVIIFQNSDELRATGGFFGSLTVITHHGATIDDWRFYDVYDLDDQIGEFPPAPPAISQYLRGGSPNLHLQDANWERDFPTSARTINRLLVAAGQPPADFIIAVNSSLIEQVLDYLGGFTYQGISLTSANFTAAARRDHDLFQVARQPKTKFLSGLATQLRQELSSWSWSDRWRLLYFVYNLRHSRHWQAFSPHPFFQSIFDLAGTSGRLQPSASCTPVYFVPSNVGVNKSNHATAITPQLINAHTTAPTLTATISNRNLLVSDALVTQRLHFANYQRLIFPPTATVSAIFIDDLPVATLDARLITDDRGREWQEVGFLHVVNEGVTATISAQLQGPNACWALFP